MLLLHHLQSCCSVPLVSSRLLLPRCCRVLDEADKRRASLTAAQAVSALRRVSIGGGPDRRGQKRKLLPAGNPVSGSIESMPPSMLLTGFQRPKMRKT
jgi:hypothetical protein